jgi:hypothetical protein
MADVEDARTYLNCARKARTEGECRDHIVHAIDAIITHIEADRNSQ